MNPAVGCIRGEFCKRENLGDSGSAAGGYTGDGIIKMLGRKTCIFMYFNLFFGFLIKY